MTELIPGLPEEIAMECLTRLHYSAHPVGAQVCRRWRHLLESSDFYYHRKQNGHTHKAACLIQARPSSPAQVEDSKPAGLPIYGVSIFDPVSVSWERIDPVPHYPDGLPLFCQLASSEGRLVLMGGWDPVTYEPLSHVSVYEFTTRRWKKAKDMPETRSFFAAGELNGKIIIAGGHDKNKNALKSAWSYDVTRDEWTELAPMSQERDECEAAVVGSELWVVSGYRTDSQGEFEGSAEAMIGEGEEEGKWRRVEEAWKATRCPRSCVGVGKEGNLVSWGESETSVGVGTCGIQSGDWTFVCGSAYQGGPYGFFTVEGGKWERLHVPPSFSGFVQSGCCVEI